MDRGIWATWYDLEAKGKNEYLSWLHTVHLPAMLARPGYLWAAHVENVVSAEREARNHARLTHVDDASVPTGFEYLLLYGAARGHKRRRPAHTRAPAARPIVHLRRSRPRRGTGCRPARARRHAGPDHPVRNLQHQRAGERGGDERLVRALPASAGEAARRFGRRPQARLDRRLGQARHP